MVRAFGVLLGLLLSFGRSYSLRAGGRLVLWMAEMKPLALPCRVEQVGKKKEPASVTWSAVFGSHW